MTSHIPSSDLQLSSGVGWHASRQLRRLNATSTMSTSHANVLGNGLESPPTFTHQFRKPPAAALPPPAPGRLADVARISNGLSSSTRIQSLAIVVVISAIFVFVTLTTTALVAVLCCKRNSVFVLHQRDHRKSEQTTGSDSDIEQCEMQELEHDRREEDGDDDDGQYYEDNNDESLPVGYYDNDSDSCGGNSDLVGVTGVSTSKQRRDRCHHPSKRSNSKKNGLEVDLRLASRPLSLLSPTSSDAHSMHRCASSNISSNNGSRTNLIADAKNRQTASGSVASSDGSSGNASVFAIDCDRQRWTADGILFPAATDADNSVTDDEPSTPTGNRRKRGKRKCNVTKTRSMSGRYSYSQLGNGSSDDDRNKSNDVVGYSPI